MPSSGSIEDEAGKLVRKEEFTDGNGSSIRYTANKTATYRIGAKTYVPNATGTFTLNVRQDDGKIETPKDGLLK